LTTLVNAKNEITKLKQNLRQDIHKQMTEKCSGDKNMITEQIINTIITEICDAINLEYSSKFASVEKMLKGLQAQIVLLENLIEIPEYRNDDIEKERISNALLIHGLSQTDGETLTNRFSGLFGTKLGISRIAMDHIHYSS